MRAVSIEGVGTEANFNWTEVCEVKQVRTTLSKSSVVNVEERSMAVSRKQVSREAKSFHSIPTDEDNQGQNGLLGALSLPDKTTSFLHLIFLLVIHLPPTDATNSHSN